VGEGKMIPTSKPVLPNKELIKAVIDDIWSTNKLSGFGKYGQMFEEKAKQFTGARYVLAVSSGDMALKLAMASMKTWGRELAMPTFTFNSTYMAADWNNFNIHLMDIDRDTLLVPLETIERLVVNDDIRTFVLVNTFGNMYNIDDLNYLKSRYDLNVLFDSAHSFGSEYGGKRSGGCGYTECFSFSPTKLITSGEGGLICTDSTDLYEEVQKRRNYGMLGDYNSTVQGCNGKISEINAAIGAYSIDMLSDLVEKKNEVVMKIQTKLNEKYEDDNAMMHWWPHYQHLTPYVRSTYKDFIVFGMPYCSQERLEKVGIQTKKYFLPLHKQLYCHQYGDFTNANDVYNNSLCIPSYTSLADDEINYIVEQLCLLE
jgi:perosamine synthetase